ncbi:transmembrane 6 superfamily member 1-like isoform X2 [Antedon mediterranea]|uniref:transmembrane 6 superfamily member 1-like isoform X2 n=1 Tax=Antedon mediterranea TaxID=105859 RepID=UPI003AF76C66
MIYFSMGELYLNTAYGTMINYWDGTAHYCMYLMMVTAIVWNQGYREIGLYWVGSVMNSIVVFLPGNIAGKFGADLKASYLLNMPYIIFPLLGAYRFLQSRKPVNIPKEQLKLRQNKSIFQRPFDLVMVIYLVLSCAFSLLRMLAAMDSPIPFAQTYVKFYEPYLLDPVIYPKLQMLVYWFYFTPYRLCAIYGLLYPGCEWMSDWALIHAGAAIQGQFSHIGSSLHSRTPYILRVPINTRPTFWVINLALLVFPQLLAWRCLTKPAFFVKQSNKPKTN